MILVFTSIDKNKEYRKFSCQLLDLEDALDVLSILVVEGNLLINAQIVEEGKPTELPVELFDGESFSAAIRQLKKQWQAVLKKPVRPAVLNHKLRVDVARQQLNLYDGRIAQLTKVIEQLEWLRQQVETIFHTDSTKTKLTNRYDKQLDMYQNYIRRAQTSRSEALEKLGQLGPDHTG